MSWPSPQDYNEALQDPSFSFADPVLAAGQTELDKLGLPRPRSGMFASVYKVRSGDKDWAVRCFLQSKPEQIHRYIQIKETLKSAALPCIVPFDLQEEGIRVSGHGFPMLKMQWCKGETLNFWLASNLRNKAVLEDFLENWRTVLASLQAAGIAHGDLQHGNILVENGQIKLVDYDGVYIPQFEGMLASELGHRSYQHPLRNETHFGPYLDNFAGWLIYLSVLISGCDPHVWQDFEGGDECLLFRRQDLDNPLESELFHVLEHHKNPQVRECSRTLRYLLTLAPEDIPGLTAPVTVPEGLPELDSVITDLPEWVSTGSESADSSIKRPAAPEGKRVLRRKRRIGGPPVFVANGEDNVSGRWLYNEQGLSFTPDASVDGSENFAPSVSTGQTLHSPVLGTYRSTPAPYRNIGGRLHSPILDSDSCMERNKEENDFSGLSPLSKGLLNVVLVFAVMICAAVGLIPTHLSPGQIWPDGEYYKLRDGRMAMEAGQYAKAEDLFKSGIIDLKSAKGSRAQMAIAYMYDNLGRIHSVQSLFPLAETDFENSLHSWELCAAQDTIDYADVLVNSAQALSAMSKYDLAEKAYKKAIEIFQMQGYTFEDEGTRNALEEYIEVLKKDNQITEAAKMELLLPKTSEQNGTEQSNAAATDNSSTENNSSGQKETKSQGATQSNHKQSVHEGSHRIKLHRKST